MIGNHHIQKVFTASENKLAPGTAGQKTKRDA